jgi:hypothetical protein
MTSLGDVIRGLLAKAEKWRGRGINEADTRALFVEPLLGALGWDVDDLDAVRREHRVYTYLFDRRPSVQEPFLTPWSPVRADAAWAARLHPHLWCPYA